MGRISHLLRLAAILGKMHNLNEMIQTKCKPCVDPEKLPKLRRNVSPKYNAILNGKRINTNTALYIYKCLAESL